MSSHDSHGDDLTADPQLGIGDQVIIKHDSKDGSRDWAGEPSGEITAKAGDDWWSLAVGEMSADWAWIVSFDEPQYLKDGSGPFTDTTVAAWRLELAPTVSADESVGAPV